MADIVEVIRNTPRVVEVLSGARGREGNGVAYGTSVSNYATQADRIGDLFFHSNGQVYEVIGDTGNGAAYEPRGVWRGQNGSDGDDGQDGDQGPPGVTRGVIQLDFSGRYYCYEDNRWVTQSAAYGVATENVNTTGGTGESASIPNDVGGHFVKAGDTISDIFIEGDRNSGDLVRVGLQLWHKGDGAIGAETLLREWRNVPVYTGKTVLVSDEFDAASEIAVPSRGKLILAARADERTGTATRYLYLNPIVRIKTDV